MINTLSEVIRLDLIKENILSEIVCNYLILYIYIYIYKNIMYIINYVKYMGKE